MQSSDIPNKSAKVFAQSATGSFVRAIPQTTADPAAASFDVGFPPQTFTDQGAGGTPPDGRDFNGILNFLSAWARWQATGAPVGYDSTFQTDIGGYPKGAVVASATTLGVFWLSTVENNLTNPDTGGAGWRRHALAGGVINMRIFTASATYTPTPGTNAVEVTVVGGGGGGGGTGAMGGSQFGAAGGGGSGGWATSYLTTGFSGQAITIGAGGAGGVGAANGSSGGNTSFGGSLSANGGGGGAYGVPTVGGSCQVGGQGGTSSGGNLITARGQGGGAAVAFTNGNQLSGAGGCTPYGGGGGPRPSNTNPGENGGGPGGGGSGAVGQSGAGAQNGGNGFTGFVLIREFA